MSPDVMPSAVSCSLQTEPVFSNTPPQKEHLGRLLRDLAKPQLLTLGNTFQSWGKNLKILMPTSFLKMYI